MNDRTSEQVRFSVHELLGHGSPQYRKGLRELRVKINASPQLLEPDNIGRLLEVLDHLADLGILASPSWNSPLEVPNKALRGRRPKALMPIERPPRTAGAGDDN